MVMGIFMAMMLVGTLYYVWGIGGAILFRERMQDAADTSAFSAAVVHARGMNILVILNVIMCALAAIEAGLHTAKDGVRAAATAADITCGICIATLGECGCCDSCTYVFPYESAASTASRVYDAGHRLIDPLMSLMHTTAQAVRTGAPIAGEALVVGYSRSNPYSPTTSIGTMIPLGANLQAEDDPTNDPCDDRVYWPAAAIAGTASLLEISFNVSAYYGAGMAVAMIFDHKDNSREYCPDYFQRVPEDSHLGEEPFQLRTVMYGDSPFRWTRGGVLMANWGNDSSSSTSIYDALGLATRLSFAQSEYFYDNVNDDPHEDYLWHQRWRGRLRRFRVGGGGVGSCTIPGCDLLETVSGMVVH